MYGIPQFFSLSGWWQNNSNESFNHWVSLPVHDTRIFCLEFPLFSESVLYAWFFQLTLFEIVLSVLKEPHTPEVVLYLTFISHRCTHKPHLMSTFRPQEGAKSDLIPTCMRMCPFIYWNIYNFSLVGFWLYGFTITLHTCTLDKSFFLLLVFSKKNCNKINMCQLF